MLSTGANSRGAPGVLVCSCCCPWCCKRHSFRASRPRLRLRRALRQPAWGRHGAGWHPSALGSHAAWVRRVAGSATCAAHALPISRRCTAPPPQRRRLGILLPVSGCPAAGLASQPLPLTLARLGGRTCICICIAVGLQSALRRSAPRRRRGRQGGFRARRHASPSTSAPAVPTAASSRLQGAHAGSAGSLFGAPPFGALPEPRASAAALDSPWRRQGATACPISGPLW